jgi:hypothetical protein
MPNPAYLYRSEETKNKLHQRNLFYQYLLGLQDCLAIYLDSPQASMTSFLTGKPGLPRLLREKNVKIYAVNGDPALVRNMEMFAAMCGTVEPYVGDVYDLISDGARVIQRSIGLLWFDSDRSPDYSYESPANLMTTLIFALSNNLVKCRGPIMVNFSMRNKHHLRKKLNCVERFTFTMMHCPTYFIKFEDDKCYNYANKSLEMRRLQKNTVRVGKRRQEIAPDANGNGMYFGVITPICCLDSMQDVQEQVNAELDAYLSGQLPEASKKYFKIVYDIAIRLRQQI